MDAAKGKAVYSVNIPRQLKKLGLTKDKYVRISFRDGYISGSCIDGSVFICQVLNSKEIKDMMTFKEPKHKLFCYCFRYPLLITVCDDWKLRVLNIDNDLKQKFSMPVTTGEEGSPEPQRNKRGSGILASAGSGLLRRRTALGASSPVLPTHTRAAQFVMFNGHVLVVASPDKLFIMKYDAEGRNHNATFISIPLQGFSGVNKKLSRIDMKNQRILIGGPAQFKIIDINDGTKLLEGELPSKVAQTFFHIKVVGDTVVAATSSDFYVWSIRGRKNVDTGTSLMTIPTKTPVSHLFVDDHYIITGHTDGGVIMWVRQTAKMIKAFNRQKSPHVPAEDEKKADSELSPFLSHSGSTRNLLQGTTFERRVNKITRWGEWIFVAYADCSLCVWDRRLEGDLDGIDRPTRNWKMKEEVDNIYLDTERGRLLLSLKQPHKLRSEKGNDEAHRIFWRTLKPKLEGFGVDPLRIQAYNMLEGSLQHKLTLCRDTNLQILRMLSTNDKLEELAVEFGPNMEMVQRHLREMLANMKVSAIDSIAANIMPLDSMYLRMLQFQEKINSLDKGSMKRFLASISLRSALEHLCSSIHRDFQQFLASCRNLDAPSNKPAETLWQNIPEGEEDVGDGDDTSDSSSFIIAPRKRGSTRKGSVEQQHQEEEKYTVEDNYAPLRKPDEDDEDVGVEPTPDELGDDEDLEFFHSKKNEEKAEKEKQEKIAETAKPAEPTEEELKISAMLNPTDDKSPAAYLWKIHFGENVFVVDRPAFMKALQTRFKLEVSEHQEKLIAHIIDNSNTGTVTKHKFGEWLKGFGPIEKAVENTSQLLCEPWFHGFITHRETELLLEKEEFGTFLVRFSESRPGAFTLAFVHKHPEKGKQILQIHIQNNPDDDEGNRFKVMQAGRGFKYFQGVTQVISSYSSFLKIPFSCSFLSQPWFFGDLTREESEELLLGSKQPGLFLIRFSQRTAFASSYIDLDGEVKHSSIVKGSSGYKTGTSSKVYPTLNDLVNDYAAALKIPLANTRVVLYQLRELVTLG